MKFYLTTDTHFNHAKILEYGRPEGYEEKILAGIRTSVPGRSTLIHLGDVAMGGDEDAHYRFMQAAQGLRKVLVLGNHDNKSIGWYYDHGWDFVCSQFRMKLYGQKILFKHIPAPKEDYYTVQVHGHTHGNDHHADELPFYDPSYHLELALENTDYQPVELEKFLGKLKGV